MVAPRTTPNRNWDNVTTHGPSSSASSQRPRRPGNQHRMRRQPARHRQHLAPHKLALKRGLPFDLQILRRRHSRNRVRSHVPILSTRASPPQTATSNGQIAPSVSSEEDGRSFAVESTRIATDAAKAIERDDAASTQAARRILSSI
jgi:hypothetical protein